MNLGLGFPTGAAKVSIAREAGRPDDVIGVTITLLVLSENVKELPEPLRKIAHGTLYQEVVKNSG